MRKIFLIVLLAHLAQAALVAQSVDFQSSNLPIILINTGWLPVPDEPKVSGTMQIIDNGPGERNYPGDLANDFNGPIGIELRGSSSQDVYPKKAYSIELRDTAGEDKPASLLGLPKESDWALIAPLNDKTLMRDMLAYRLAAQVMDWAPHTRYAEVVLNGDYIGVYMLVETIKRDKNRVNISKLTETDLAGDSLTGGYILSFDKTDGGGLGGDWASPYAAFPGSKQQTWFQIVYPKTDHITGIQRVYIHDYIDAFERVMANWIPNKYNTTPAYEDWIEPDSWANYILINEISKNVDAYRISTYFYKDRDSKDPRIHMGPVWDYNIAFGIGNYCEAEKPAGWMKNFNHVCAGDSWGIHFWWEKICRDYAFQQRMTDHWRDYRSTIWTNDQLIEVIDSTADLLAEAQVRNFQRWPVMGEWVWPDFFVGPTYKSEVDYLKDWLLQRVKWMDNNIETVGPLDLVHFPYVESARIFPNPVTPGGNLNLAYSTDSNAPLTFALFDASGRQVLSPQSIPVGKWIRYSQSVPAGLDNGVYYYRIEADGKPVKVGKILVER